MTPIAFFIFPLLSQTSLAQLNSSRQEDAGRSDRHLMFSHQEVPLVRLTRDLLSKERYDARVRPISNYSDAVQIHISMSLYQIIDVNEPSQNIKMNIWMIQKWSDEMLGWDPHEYGMINSTILPHDSLWIPDTYLYNSVVMSRDETERYMNVQVSTRYWEGKPGANISFLYPTIHTIICRLNVRYFPYDQQNCTLTISSWTNSKSALDYFADRNVNMQSFIPNDEWDVVSFRIYRHEYKYACCPEPWTIIEAALVIRRKPLYYVVNLIIPTSIITIVSITGFFTPASTSDDRTEKINLGITTLLAMSILMLMVSDQMPTTSDFVPLIAWFYLSIIIIISIGTFLTSIVLGVQGRRRFGKMPSELIRILFFMYIARWLCVPVPTQLTQLWEEFSDHPIDTHFLRKSRGKKGSVTEDGIASPPLKNERRALIRNNWDGSKRGVPRVRVEEPSEVVKDKPKRSNWLKIPVAIAGSEGKSEPPAMDASNASSPKSPLSPAASQHESLWEPTMMLVGFPNDRKPSKHSHKGKINLRSLNGVQQHRRTASYTPLSHFSVEKAVSSGVMDMKRRRQCSLEWEFLATILDRVLLILFTVVVLIVTVGLIATGHMAQYGYDHIAQ